MNVVCKMQFEFVVLFMSRIKFSWFFTCLSKFIGACFSQRFFFVNFFHILLKLTNIDPVQFFVGFLHSLPILVVGQQFFLLPVNFLFCAFKFLAG